MANCKTCSATNVCTTCKDGYYKDTGGACQLCGYTCKTCDPANKFKCLTCYTSADTYFVGSNRNDSVSPNAAFICPCASNYFD
jgi:hypothetical protein